MSHRRNRINQTVSFEERLADEANRLREQAKKLKPGLRRDQLIRKAQQAENTVHISKWLTSPGPASPK